MKTFEAVARYDADISNYLGSIDIESETRGQFPQTITTQYERQEVMRYGENPHQDASSTLNRMHLRALLRVQLSCMVKLCPTTTSLTQMLLCSACKRLRNCLRIVKHANLAVSQSQQTITPHMTWPSNRPNVCVWRHHCFQWCGECRTRSGHGGAAVYRSCDRLVLMSQQWKR